MKSTYSELNKTPYLVSTEWLADHLKDPGLVLVDCRYYFDGRDGLVGIRQGASAWCCAPGLEQEARGCGFTATRHVQAAITRSSPRGAGTIGNLRFEHGGWL